MRNKNDCNGMEVKIDLNEMIKVTGCAVYNAKTQMEEYKHKIEWHLEKACYLKDNDHDKYIHLCNANTATEGLTVATQQYADAVSMYFYLMQAKARETITIIRENKNDKT